MSEMHTNTTADTDKYILNGVGVTPNEFIDIVTNFLEAQQSRLRRRDARIAELEAALSGSLPTVQLGIDLEFEKRKVAELEAYIDQLIEAGDGLVGDCELNWKHNHIPDCPPANHWQALVDDWKER